MEEIINKNMFVILNDENKILTFSVDDSEQTKVFLPYMIQGRDFITPTPLANIVLEEYSNDDFELLLESKKSTPRFECSNNKLNPNRRVVNKRYYVSNKSISKEFIENILDYCYKNNVYVDFFTFEELKNILTKRDMEYAYERYFNFAVNKLEKKLNYDEY